MLDMLIQELGGNMATVHLSIRRPIVSPKNAEGKLKSGVKRGIKKSALTRSVKQQIYEGVRIGMPMSRAAELAGINKNLFNMWMKRGQSPKPYPKFYRFINKLKQIERQREKEALEVIRNCGKGGFETKKTKIKIVGDGDNKQTTVEKTVRQSTPQWQAMAWYLERLHKKYYSREAVVDESTTRDRAKEISDLIAEIDKTIPGANNNGNS